MKVKSSNYTNLEILAIISQKRQRNILLKKGNLNLKGLYLREFKGLRSKITIFFSLAEKSYPDQILRDLSEKAK